MLVQECINTLVGSVAHCFFDNFLPKAGTPMIAVKVASWLVKTSAEREGERERGREEERERENIQV
jgi:hypothetical protein